MQTILHADSVVRGLGREQSRLYKNMAVLLFSGDDVKDPSADYLLCTEALAQQVLTIQETGRVSALDIVSTAVQPILILAGQYFRGGGQDRIAAASIVLAPGAAGKLPTRCVERHRWNPQAGQTFATLSEGSLAGSIVTAGSSIADQGDTWADVQSLSSATETHSGSERLGDVQETTADRRRPYVEALRATPLTEQAVGALFVVEARDGRRHVALDVFGTAHIFQAMWNDLCDSVALAAIAFNQENDAPDVTETTLLESLCRAETELAHTPLTNDPIPLNRGTLRFGSFPQQVGTAALLEDQTSDISVSPWLVHLRIRSDSHT